MEPMLNKIPWQEELSYPVLRFLWILFSLFILPTLLILTGVRESLAPAISTLTALPACIAGSTKLGIDKLSVADGFIIPAFYAAIILTSAVPSLLWKLLLDAYGGDFSQKQEILDIIKNSPFQDRIYMFMSVCVLTPIIEEVAFRRIIFSWFRKLWKSALPSVLITSLLFSVAHFFVMGIPGLFIMGLGFQIIYIFRRNLLSAILLHALVNSVAFLINFYDFTEIS